MKIYISASTTAAKLAKAEKDVRMYIWTVWSSGTDGRVRDFYSDPEMLCNIVRSNYADSDHSVPYSKYVFNNRYELFEDRVMEYIDKSKYPEEIKDHMREYFYNLNQSDYNRNLYLKRDENKKYKS